MLNQKLDRVKIKFLMDIKSAFIASCLFDVAISIDKDTPTACITTTELKFGEDFIRDMEDPPLLGLLAHEIWHNVLGHNARVNDIVTTYGEDSFQLEAWQIATDVAVNTILEDADYTLPEGGVMFSSVSPKYPKLKRGMSAEEIYSILLEDPTKMPSMPQSGDLGGKGEGDTRSTDRILQDAEHKAMSVSQEVGIGSLPSYLQTRISELMNPPIPWQTHLMHLANSISQTDYSYLRPNYRHLEEGVIIPSLYEPCVDDINLYVDTSGSIYGDIGKLISAINALRIQLNPQLIRITSWDTQLHNVQEFDESRVLTDYVVEGGGGTIIDPVLERIIANNETISIILTDGAFNYPNLHVNGHLFWLHYGDYLFNPPQGTVIKYVE